MDTSSEEKLRSAEKEAPRLEQSELEAALASLESGWDFADQVKGNAIAEVQDFTKGVPPAIVARAERVEKDIRAAAARTEQQIKALDHDPKDRAHEKEEVRVEVVSLITELQNQGWYVTDDMVQRAQHLVGTYRNQEKSLADPVILLGDIITGSYSPEERLGGIRTLFQENPGFMADISLNLGDAPANMPAEAAAVTETAAAVSAEEEEEAGDGADDAYAPHSSEAVLEADQAEWASRQGHLRKYIEMLEDPARSKTERMSERPNLAAAKKALELYQTMLAEAPLETELVGLTRQLLVFHPTTEAERDEQRAMQSRVDALRLKRGEAKARIQDLSTEFKKAEVAGELTLDDVLATAQDGVVRKAAKDRVPPPPNPEETRRLEKQARTAAQERLTSVMQELERAREGGDPERISLCYANSMKAYDRLINAYSSAKELDPNERLDLGVIRCDKQIVHHEHQASVFKAEMDATTDPKVREEKEKLWMKELDAKKSYIRVKAEMLSKKSAKPETEGASGPVSGKVLSPMDTMIALLCAMNDPAEALGKIAGGFLEGKAEQKH